MNKKTGYAFTFTYPDRALRAIGSGIFAFIFMLAPLLLHAQVSYSVSPSGPVCLGNGVIRLQAENQSRGKIVGNGLTLVISKTTDKCDFGGTFNQGGRVSIREGSQTGPEVWSQGYEADVAEVIVSRPLKFGSGEKEYFAVIEAGGNLYWDGPVTVKADGPAELILTTPRCRPAIAKADEQIEFSIDFLSNVSNSSGKVFVLWPGKSQWAEYSLQRAPGLRGKTWSSGLLSIPSGTAGEGKFRFEVMYGEGFEAKGDLGPHTFIVKTVLQTAPILSDLQFSPERPMTGATMTFSAKVNADTKPIGTKLSIIWPGKIIPSEQELKVTASGPGEYLLSSGPVSIPLNVEVGTGKATFEVIGPDQQRLSDQLVFPVSRPNRPPSLSELKLEPAEGRMGKTVQISVLFSDPDGDAAAPDARHLWVKWPGKPQPYRLSMQENPTKVPGNVRFTLPLEIPENAASGMAKLSFDFRDAQNAPAPFEDFELKVVPNNRPAIISNFRIEQSGSEQIRAVFNFRDPDQDEASWAASTGIAEWPNGENSPRLKLIPGPKSADGVLEVQSEPFQRPAIGGNAYFVLNIQMGGPAPEPREFPFEIRGSGNSGPYLSTPEMFPPKAIPGETVTFSVIYTSPDNQAPREYSGRVFVSWPGFPRETSYPLTTIDANFAGGSKFSSGLVPVKSNEPGKIEYRFEFFDSRGNPIPVLGGDVWVDEKTAATPVWVPEDPVRPTLSDPGLNPDPVSAGEEVRFFVTYRDKQGEAPQSGLGGLEVRWPGQTDWNRLEIRAEKGDYANGVLCTSPALTVPSGVSGTGIFRFFFKDESGNLAVENAEEYTFSVIDGYRKPFLTRPAYQPAMPEAGKPIRFAVKFTDLDNRPPADVYRNVRVKWANSKVWNQYPMKSDSEDFFDGGIFRSEEIMIPESAEGSAMYEIEFRDSRDQLVEGSNLTRYFEVKPATRVPELYAARVRPSGPVEVGSELLFAIRLRDPSGQAPTTARVKIIWQGSPEMLEFKLSAKGENFKEGVVFESERLNTMDFQSGIAQFSYSFVLASGQSLESPTYQIEFIKSNPDPVLSDARSSEFQVKKGEPFELSILYTDTEGDLPGPDNFAEIKWPEAENWERVPLNSTCSDPFYGCRLSTGPLVYSGEKAGMLKYRFGVRDSSGAAANGNLQEFELKIEKSFVASTADPREESISGTAAVLKEKYTLFEEEGILYATFTCVYREKSGKLPPARYRSLEVRWPGRADWMSYTLLPQGEEGKGTIFSSGAIKTPPLSGGTGEYKFEFLDHLGKSPKGSGTPHKISIALPDQPPGISAGKVEPQEAVAGSPVFFSLVYNDPNGLNTLELAHHVEVKWPGQTTWSRYSMSPTSSNFTGGVIFRTSPVQVDASFEGRAEYRFDFRNSKGKIARGAPEGGIFYIHTDQLILPFLSLPEDEAAVVGTPLSFDWEKIPGALRYRIQVSADLSSFTAEGGFGKSMYLDQVTNDPWYDWYGSPPSGKTYYWSVQAIGEGDAPSPFAAPRSFTYKRR